MFTPTRSTRSHSFLTFILFLLICLAAPSWAVAQEKDSEAPVGAVGGAVHADLFTGTATTSIPIEVPPGRQGVQPQLALVYGSANGNGWVGMGWKLEKSVIERRTKDGLDYTADDYVVRLSGINAELVPSMPRPIPIFAPRWKAVLPAYTNSPRRTATRTLKRRTSWARSISSARPPRRGLRILPTPHGYSAGAWIVSKMSTATT